MSGNCCCGSSLAYERCCGVYHANLKTPETAEQLMRSRYSAFVLGKVDYLKQTWVSTECPEALVLDGKTRWVQLQILTTEKGQPGDQSGVVEFKAWLIEQDRLMCLHEVSQFQYENSRWLYQNGQIIDEPVVPLSMNQLCPCGSGKKYKRCCRS